MIKDGFKEASNSIQTEVMKNSNQISVKLKNEYRLFRSIAKEEIIKAIKTSKNKTEVLRILRCSANDKNYFKLKDFCETNNISTSHFTKKMTKEDYYKNPKYCKNCGKIIPYERKDNIFCDSSCACSYNNLLNNKKYVTRKENTKVKHLLTNYDEKEIISSNRHNKLIDEKYSDLRLVHINSGCCPICGTYHCTNEFCKEHNFQQLIGLVNIGLNPKKIGTLEIFNEFERIRNILYDKYWTKNLSALDLMKEYDIKSESAVYNILDHLNIKRRDLSESAKLAILNGKSNILVSGNIFGKNIHSEHHISWDGKTVFLRSSYEIDFANELDSNKIKYEVESIRIKYFDSTIKQERVAVPDFYLPETNEIVEIKSDFTLDIQEMLDKFDVYKKLGYNVKLILEHEEIDLYNIENLISKERLKRIKTKNIKILKILKIKDTNNNNTD